MEVCANCGHPLGVGRFCTNCGHRVDQSAPVAGAEAGSEAASAAGPPILPPPAVEPPPQARYPLFADDLPTRTAAASAPPTPPPTLPPTAPPTLPPPVFQPAPEPAQRVRSRTRRTRAAWLPWAVGAIALLLVAMVGALLLMDGDDDSGRDQTAGATSTEPSSNATKDRPKSPKPTEEPPAGEGPIDIARYAGLSVPDTAPPNLDVSGNQVRYEARNMVDGVPETCWRMPGSGAGEEIVFTFLEPVEITEVGLINGYAKTAGDLDWYTGNRRVREVEWVFDDGTTVEQTLDSTRDLQRLPIDAVTTTSLTLRLLDVSDPGRGRSARNYTAISDVSVVGEPA